MRRHSHAQAHTSITTTTQKKKSINQLFSRHRSLKSSKQTLGLGGIQFRKKYYNSLSGLIKVNTYVV